MIDYQVELLGGQYTYIRYKNGGQEALRYGDKWRNLTGDGFVYSLGAKVEELAAELERVQAELLTSKEHLDSTNIACNKAEKERDELKRQVEELNQQLETALCQARYIAKSNEKNFNEADQLRTENTELRKALERLKEYEASRNDH